MGEPVLRDVYLAKNTADAHVAKLFLAEEGIVARISGEQLQSAIGELPPGPPSAPSLLVREADYESAKQLIRQMESLRRLSESIPEQPPWSCPECQEEVDGTFDICWNCQHDRISDNDVK